MRKIFLFILVGILINSCEKVEEPAVPTLPTVRTTNVSGIMSMTATLTGTILSDGGAEIIEKGFLYSKASNPTLGSAYATGSYGGNLGSFTEIASNLTPFSTYYYKAFAINEAGTGYGEVKSFRAQ